MKQTDSPGGHGHAASPVKTDVDGTRDSDPTAKLEAMSKEREALRAEVEQLRKQLETIQILHEQEVSRMKTDLEESNSAKEHAEEQYQTLLERVEKIKESLSDRLKRDKAELEEARERIEELETQNEQLQGSAQSTGEDVEKLKEELQDATRELSTLRSRNNLSAHNWHREKEELILTVQHLKEEMETTANAMGEWEVLAMEERSTKENLLDKVSDLEEQMATLRRHYEAAAADRDSQSTLVDNLQNALREIQDARKKELRDMVETTESQLQALKMLAQQAEARATDAEEAKEVMAKELERTAPFEKEVKEKNLLIGKLRHEAIILNDHLTKALRYLKKTKPEDNVDRYVRPNCSHSSFHVLFPRRKYATRTCDYHPRDADPFSLLADKSSPTTSSTSSPSTAATPNASRSSKSWPATSTGRMSSASKPASPDQAPPQAVSACQPAPFRERPARRL